MSRYLTIILSMTFLLAGSGISWSYNTVDVQSGATIKGSVIFPGDVPSVEVIKVTEDNKYCGNEKATEKYIVSDARVKNAVVWLENVTIGKAIPESRVVVGIDECMARPHVSVGFVGGEYLFRNNDDILHTVQLKLSLAYQKLVSDRPLEDGSSVYNIALPKKGHEIRKPIRKWHRYTSKTGLIRIRSNTHNWINGFIFIFDHPYAVATGADGTFILDDIPPGDYLLRVWHEGFGYKEREISLGNSQIMQTHIDFSE